MYKIRVLIEHDYAKNKLLEDDGGYRKVIAPNALFIDGTTTEATRHKIAIQPHQTQTQPLKVLSLFLECRK